MTLLNPVRLQMLPQFLFLMQPSLRDPWEGYALSTRGVFESEVDFSTALPLTTLAISLHSRLCFRCGCCGALMKCLACMKVQALPLSSGAGLVRQLHVIPTPTSHLPPCRKGWPAKYYQAYVLMAAVPVAASIFLP
jgi:hypothetical protein